MTFYRYLQDCDVHVLDCAGNVDVPVGLARLGQLSQELGARPARDGVHRLLIDFRHTEWASEEAHRELSRAARSDFGLNAGNPLLRLAFVFHGGHGMVSNSEGCAPMPQISPLGRGVTTRVNPRPSWSNT